MPLFHAVLCGGCRHAEDPQIKLAISFALAQSTKLSVLEERGRIMGRQLSRLPVALAESGEIPASERDIMRVRGGGRGGAAGLAAWRTTLAGGPQRRRVPPLQVLSRLLSTRATTGPCLGTCPNPTLTTAMQSTPTPLPIRIPATVTSSTHLPTHPHLRSTWAPCSSPWPR
jgi:hypothetical protein